MKDINSAHKTCCVTPVLFSLAIHCTLLTSSRNNTEILLWGPGIDVSGLGQEDKADLQKIK